MSKLGPKIVESLKEAITGDFTEVTIEGQRWVRISKGDVVVSKRELFRMIGDARSIIEWAERWAET